MHGETMKLKNDTTVVRTKLFCQG